MSKYTTEIRYICENYAGCGSSTGENTIESIIQTAIPHIFNFNYPIFDADYRNVLETKIIKHYYTREICEETVGLWKLRLNTRMNEIMPYYNQLYKSELLEFNPFFDVDLTRDHNVQNNNNKNDSIETIGDNNITLNSKIDYEGKNISDISSNSKVNETNKDIYSDTPQGSLYNIDNETYLTNARKKIDESTNINTSKDTTNSTNKTTSENTNSEKLKTNATSKSEIKNTEDYLEHVNGKQSGTSYSKMLDEYRNTFLNIDKMILEDISDLFFRLW
jgi:hypothetical protein